MLRLRRDPSRNVTGGTPGEFVVILSKTEVQPSRVIKRMRDEEQIITKKKQKKQTYETTDAQTKKNCNRGTALERSESCISSV